LKLIDFRINLGLPLDNSILVDFQNKTKHYNYFVFGHHHLPMTLEVRKDSEYVHLGDWVSYFIDGFLMEKK